MVDGQDSNTDTNGYIQLAEYTFHDEQDVYTQEKELTQYYDNTIHFHCNVQNYTYIYYVCNYMTVHGIYRTKRQYSFLHTCANPSLVA